ncbi:MAG: stalk domain-containing protein [Peptococcaceae bacterium]|nr:stalk domain-containing protein [Peptococcaceae bacterium]
MYRDGGLRRLRWLVLAMALLAGFALPAWGDAPQMVRFVIGSSSYSVDGVARPMDAPAVIIGGRAYVPLRYVGDALGLLVGWDPATRAVTLGASPKPDQPAGTVISGRVQPYAPGDISGVDMPVNVEISGPGGATAQVRAILDTGASMSLFPEDVLRSLGYQPVSGYEQGQATPAIGGPVAFTLYRINYPLVRQGEAWVPLGQGQVYAGGVAGANESLIGDDILSRDDLTLKDGTWTLTVP